MEGCVKEGGEKFHRGPALCRGGILCPSKWEWAGMGR